MTIPATGTRDAASPGACEIEQIKCPIERVRAINAIAKQVGTIPGPLARMRTAALEDARKAVQTTAELALQVGMTRSRVSTLLNHPYPEPAPAGS